MSDRLAEIKQRLADDAYGCVPDYGAEADAGPDIEWLVKRLEAANDRLGAVIVDYVCGGKPPEGEPLRTWYFAAIAGEKKP